MQSKTCSGDSDEVHMRATSNSAVSSIHAAAVELPHT